MAAEVGFEPTKLRLQRPTTLPICPLSIMAEVLGHDPNTVKYVRFSKPTQLLTNYCFHMAGVIGFDPIFLLSESSVLPIRRHAITWGD